MSKVTVAKSAGFCFGVDRAVKMVYSELENNTHVATLGPIIHNQDVVNDMQAKGARIIENVDELKPDETVVIRSHGVGKKIYDQIQAKGNRMLDATCPFVSRIHKIVAEKSAEGYFILIAGDRNHPEVQGIVGHCDENWFGKTVEYGGGPVRLLINILWLIFGGLAMAAEFAIFGLLLCITIIGIPFGLQMFKLAKLSLMPFGAEVK